MSEPKRSRVKLLKFHILTANELVRQSVTKECERYDGSNVPDGVYREFTSNKSSEGTVVDLRMGCDGSEIVSQDCETCGKKTDICGGLGGQFDCPGHPGHINLYSPQIWVLFSSELVRILESVCPRCSKRINKIPVRHEKCSRRVFSDESNENPEQDVIVDVEEELVDAEEAVDPDDPDVDPVDADVVDDADEADDAVDLEDDVIDPDVDDALDPDEEDLISDVLTEISDVASVIDASVIDEEEHKDSYYRCRCFHPNSCVRFKYYVKNDESARYIEVKVSARNMQNERRTEVSETFIIPNAKIHKIFSKISQQDWIDIFCAQNREHPRKQPIPYNPVDLLVTKLPVIPPIARPSKRVDNKRPADIITRFYNQILLRNDNLRKLMLEPTSSTAKKTRKKKNLSAALEELYDDDDPTGKAFHDHVGNLDGIDESLDYLLRDFVVCNGPNAGIPVGKLYTSNSFNIFRAERALGAAISYLIDKNNNKNTKTNSNQVYLNLVARLSGKTGRFRQHLAGKRVNYSARTVITPDPDIELDEVSIPYSFARTETRPLKVTSWNIEKVRDLVRKDQVKKIVNGNDTYRCDTDDLVLRERNAIERIQEGVTVHRYLQDGDLIIMNRQPTLHRPSMMAHRVRIRPPVEKNVTYCFGGVVHALPPQTKNGTRECNMQGFSTQKDNLTFGLNLSVTRPYNADFDGDEMNAHICQTLESVAEMLELMRVDKQLGCKFIGIVQDTLLGSYLMCCTDTFFSEEFATYVYTCASGKYPELPPFPKPVVIKPKKLWTGRQLLSLVFHNVAFDYNVSQDPTDDTNEDPLVIKNGNIIAGQICKKHFGEGGYLMTVITTNFGYERAAKVINYFQAFVGPYVLRRGISVGIKDCVPSDEAINTMKRIVNEYPSKLTHGMSELDIQKFVQSVDAELAKVVINDAKKYGNRIRQMTQSGSKGSDKNLIQIQGCLGQQNVGGRRPFSDERRVFPLDQMGDNTLALESNGFIVHSLIDGLTPREYFCHAAGGREGIIDTGIKTSKTGYSTRRISCVTEGASVSFMGSVMNQSILQGVLTSLLYGADGMDASKLIRHQLLLHKCSYDSLESEYLSFVDEPSLRQKMLHQLREDRELIMNINVHRKKNEALFMLPVDIHHIVRESLKNTNDQPRESIPLKLFYDELFVFSVKKYVVYRKCTSKHGRELNEVATRLFRIMLRQTFCKMYYKLSKLQFEHCIMLIQDSFQRSQVQAGEPVGLIATQSLMQAIMQATLNTFHTAGTGASAAATGGLNYFDALISVQTPKITTTTIILNDPSKEFLVMDAIAPPVKFCDVVVRVHDNFIPEANGSNNNVWCLGNTISTSTTRIIQFRLSEELMFKKRVCLEHIFQALTLKIGSSKIDIVSRDEIRIYIPKLLYTRMIIEELLDTIIISPRVTPRGKDKNYRGIVGARRVLNESLVIENNELVVKKFVQIEVYGNFKLMDVFCIDGVDCQNTKCNDILELQNTLGTHAARNFLTSELYRTVCTSGNVSPRFVMQVVDYMTWTGRIEPVTRHGMKFFGPLKSAAFEQPSKVLVNAALACKTEHMLSPTANVVFGQELRGIGTGIIDVIPKDIDFTSSKVNNDGNEEGLREIDYESYAMPFLQFLSIDEPKHEIEMVVDNDDLHAPFMVDDDEFIVQKEEVRMEDNECPFDF
jgi:DNA-directed RNA polymerase beta' subunit